MLVGIAVSLAAMMARTPQCPHYPKTEFIINAITAGLVHEGLMPPGSILDIGANDGVTSCFYARLDPSRTVHALDPVRANALSVMRLASMGFPNLKGKHGAMGAVETVMSTQVAVGQVKNLFSQAGARQAGGAGGGTTFQVHTINNFFSAEKVGLLHIDVEGSELDVLKGGRNVIMRDKPLIVAEVKVYENATLTLSLLHHMAGMGYRLYLVQEEVGDEPHIRNVLAIPQSRMDDLEGSITLAGFAAARALVQLTSPQAIFDYVLPCCRQGGECCPVSVSGGARCCTKALVDAHIARTGTRRGTESWHAQMRCGLSWPALLQRPHNSHPASPPELVGEEYIERKWPKGLWRKIAAGSCTPANME